MTIIKNSAVIADACSQRITALKDNVTAKTEIAMDGASYTPAQLTAIYQACLDTRAALVKSRAQAKTDLSARRKAEASRLAIEPGLKAWVIAKFGANSTEAGEFGYGPRKVGQKSAETKANAAKLAKATREARGTMGKKQKKGIKGTLAVSTDTPAAPPVTAAEPAPVVASPAKTNGAPAAPVVAVQPS